MTELETMQRAKMYLDKLAEGTDPITGQQVPPQDSLSSPRLSRCFRYVSGILEKVIQNGGQVGAVEKPPFTITPQQLANVQLTGEPLRIADFVERVLRATNYEGMKKLSPVKLTNWLLTKGFLTQETDAEGKSRRVPTAAGAELGISTQMCEYKGSQYPGIFYDINAQKFLLDHIAAIIEE
ncbi:MAG: hypothetical protein IKM59_00870 [Oscillospiraceae bacterium]|nr:hypothetical protein [Oscillospiraceae bacterium]